MIFGKVSVDSFFDSLQTDNLGPLSDVGQLVAVSLVGVFVFVLGKWQQLQEQIVDYS